MFSNNQMINLERYIEHHDSNGNKREKDELTQIKQSRHTSKKQNFNWMERIKRNRETSWTNFINSSTKEKGTNTM